jgi:hypothetical protein
MRIINGGIKMSLKGKGRMRELTKYYCVKCEKLWGLTPNAIYVTNSGPKFCGYDRSGRKKWRKQGHCECGTAFNYPVVYVDE